MPSRSPRPCSWAGCGTLTLTRYCTAHTASQQRQEDARRGSARARGYDARWQRLRRAHLAIEPLCRFCNAKGRTTAATVVDHITPHRGKSALLYDPTNLQSLCKPCHDSEKQRIERRRRPHGSQ